MFSRFLVLSVLVAAPAFAVQDHHHDHGSEEKKQVERPKVFLDKSPRVVEYQLKRLDNARLLLVERKTDDKKYAPVYRAILTRAGISPQHREESALALVEINKSNLTTELLDALAALKSAGRQETRTARQLTQMLLDQSADELKMQQPQLEAATGGKNGFVKAAAHAGLITAGAADAAWAQTKGNEDAISDWLAAVPLVENADQLRPRIVSLLDESRPNGVRAAAATALASVTANQPDTFRRLAPLAAEEQLQAAAIRTLNRIPPKHYDREAAQRLANHLVQRAEATPAAQRTTDEFLDAMQLADRLFGRIPTDTAKAYRARLSEITVRVIRVHTVEEEMRYDIPWFAVQAGKPVQVILRNEDLMPHNLVITTPGSLQEVAQLGLEVGPNNGADGKQYVPDSEKVLYATNMVQPEKQERLTFTAPEQPGEYPYVCTFPRHWMRMYGVMVVVEDLDARLKNPTEPKDPVGRTRAFVQSWKLKDFRGELQQGLRGRSPEIGERIFTEATCALCHKIKGQGGAVGPELTDVLQRWKGDRLGVLREILEPSHRIEPKYAVRVVITDEGETVSGIVQSEDKDKVALLPNPEAKELVIIEKSAIDEMVATSTSMMPKALLDRFTKDEIFELLAYLEWAGQ